MRSEEVRLPQHPNLEAEAVVAAAARLAEADSDSKVASDPSVSARCGRDLRVLIIKYQYPAPGDTCWEVLVSLDELAELPRLLVPPAQGPRRESEVDGI